jgi:hypothetical protein
MEIVFAAIAIMCLGTFGLSAKSNMKCTDITDIYTPRDLYEIVYDKDCPYTKTIICESSNDCGSHYINRYYYEDFMREYDELGLPRPFQKRTDTDNVFPAGILQRVKL